jgi:hypothetical protein
MVIFYTMYLKMWCGYNVCARGLKTSSCKFFTIEVPGSSRELEALFDGGHGLVSLCLFSVIE